MHLCLIFLLYAVVYGMSRIPEPNPINFVENITGRKLDRSLIRGVKVDSESSCQLQCVQEERCLSCNFETAMDDVKNLKSQLSSSDRFAGFANFTESKDFTFYRGIKVITINLLRPYFSNGDYCSANNLIIFKLLSHGILSRQNEFTYDKTKSINS